MLDSHGTHETTGLIAKAREANILLFCLPAHTTHYLQPLDRSIFGPFKTSYDKMCSEYLQNPDNMVTKMTWPGLFQQAFEEAMIPPNIFAGFAATGIYPWNPLAIPSAAFLPSKAFLDGTIPSVTKQHPLAWVVDKIAEAEATITLEASDNNVLSILRTSIAIALEKINAATSSASISSTEQEPEIVQESVSDMVENQMVASPEAPELESTSPLISLDSGLSLRDLLEPEVEHFVDTNINDLMAQIDATNASACNRNVVPVDPVVKLDPQTIQSFPPTEDDRVIQDVFTPKMKGKVRTRGGGHVGRGRGSRGSQSQSRLLTSDEIYQFKQEQEKVKEEKKKKALERKQEKVEYHLKQLAKLQK